MRSGLLAAYYGQRRAKPIPAGAVLYAPMDRAYQAGDVLPTGQAIGRVAGRDPQPIVAETFQGVRCVRMTSTVCDNIAATLPHNNADFSLSEWVSPAATASGNNLFCAWWADGASAQRVAIGNYNAQVYFVNGANNTGQFAIVGAVDVGRWHHYCLVHRSGRSTFYTDGAAVGTWSKSNSISQAACVAQFGVNSAGWTVRLAALRIYARALDADEVAQLAAEYTPTE